MLPGAVMVSTRGLRRSQASPGLEDGLVGLVAVAAGVFLMLPWVARSPSGNLAWVQNGVDNASHPIVIGLALPVASCKRNPAIALT